MLKIVQVQNCTRGEDMKRLLIGFTAMLTFSGVYADTLTGKVVKVADGDTVTVLAEGNKQVRIRLAGIDAPERKQAYGKKSKTFLSGRVAGQLVSVTYEKKDRYGRIVGVIWLDGKDINLEVIKAGLAWHYKRYQREQSAQDRVLYADAEQAAKVSKLNLWSDRKPIPPWE